MFICAARSWFRRVAVAATAFGTVALCIGTVAQPAAAQVYPGYSSAPSQSYPGYSYQAPGAPAQGYAGYGYSGAYPGYGYSGAYPGYGYSGADPGYGYSGAYPYYPYPYWGWAGGAVEDVGTAGSAGASEADLLMPASMAEGSAVAFTAVGSAVASTAVAVAAIVNRRG